MRVVATIANAILILMTGFVLQRDGIPYSGVMKFLVSLMLVAPIASMIAIWWFPLTEATGWIALELQARKAVLRRRIGGDPRC